MKQEKTKDPKSTNYEIRNFRNPRTGLLTEVMLFHNIRIISIATRDKFNPYYWNKITMFINKLLTEFANSKKYDLSLYEIKLNNI